MNEEDMKDEVNEKPQDTAQDMATEGVADTEDEEFTFESPIFRRELKLRMGDETVEIHAKKGWLVRLLDRSDDTIQISYGDVASVSLHLYWRVYDLIWDAVFVALMLVFPFLRAWFFFLITVVGIAASGSIRVRFQMKDGQRKTLYCDFDKRKELISALNRKFT